MPEIGEIDLKKLKVRYSIEDINLVDIRDLNYANELRLYFEIFFSIGVCLLGVTVSTFNWYLLSGTLLFTLIGFFFLGRFWYAPH